MIDDLKLWLSISNQSNVPHTLLLTARVLDFHGNMFSIKTNEKEEEILRRHKEDVYYLETVRIFEEAFGLKRLEKTIKEV